MHEGNQAASVIVGDPTARSALDAVGARDYELRQHSMPDPMIPNGTVQRGVARCADGDLYYFVKAESTPIVLIKADTPEKRHEGETLWSQLEPDAGASISSGATPDRAGHGYDWKGDTAAKEDDPPDEDDDAKALRGLRKASERLHGTMPGAPQRQVLDYKRDFLRQGLGYSEADIESGRIALRPDQHAAAARFQAERLRKAASPLQRIIDEEE